MCNLGDNPAGGWRSWSAPSSRNTLGFRIPTYRRSWSPLWLPHLSRWLTQTERLASMGFPSSPTLGASFRAGDSFYLSYEEARAAAGNCMHVASLGVLCWLCFLACSSAEASMRRRLWWWLVPTLGVPPPKHYVDGRPARFTKAGQPPFHFPPTVCAERQILLTLPNTHSAYRLLTCLFTLRVCQYCIHRVSARSYQRPWVPVELGWKGVLVAPCWRSNTRVLHVQDCITLTSV